MSHYSDFLSRHLVARDVCTCCFPLVVTVWLSKISRLEIFHALKVGFCFHHFAEAAFAKVISDFILQTWWQISTSLLFFLECSAAFARLALFLHLWGVLCCFLQCRFLISCIFEPVFSVSLGGLSNHLTFWFHPELLLFSYFMCFLGDISSNLNVLIFICFGYRLLQQATWNSVV